MEKNGHKNCQNKQKNSGRVCKIIFILQLIMFVMWVASHRHLAITEEGHVVAAVGLPLLAVALVVHVFASLGLHHISLAAVDIPTLLLLQLALTILLLLRLVIFLLLTMFVLQQVSAIFLFQPWTMLLLQFDMFLLQMATDLEICVV